MSILSQDGISMQRLAWKKRSRMVEEIDQCVAKRRSLVLRGSHQVFILQQRRVFERWAHNTFHNDKVIIARMAKKREKPYNTFDLFDVC